MDLTHAIDALMEPVCKPSEPGAAVIVARNGTVVFRKGYGLANLEPGVAIEPHMVFRLGSMTKQVTAVTILMLVEQGTLSLGDDITTFWPDYPTQGHRITVEQLLAAVKIAALAIGQPYQEPVAIMLDTATLDAYVGVYDAYVGVYKVDENEQAEQIVTRDGAHLSIQRTGGQREEIFPLSPTEVLLQGFVHALCDPPQVHHDGR
jgi:Beta-lactamase